MAATKSIGVRELKTNPGKILRMVRDEHEQVDVTIRGEVVARIVPVRPGMTPEEHEAVWKRHKEIADQISASWPKGVSAVDAIREVRREL